MSRVYLGRLSHRAQERDIERFFRGFGRLKDIMLKNGYGFVEFEDYRDADDAVYELSGQMLCGERIVIEHARGTPHGEDLRRDQERGLYYPQSRRDDRGSGRSGYGSSANDKYGPPTRTDYRLIVENLSSRVSWQDLKDHMRSAGEVTYADAHKDHKNEGVVEFASRRELQRAIEKLDGTELSGRKIRLVEYSKKSRRRSRSKSRSRRRSSRDRTRSRSRRRSSSRSKTRNDRRRSKDRDDESKSRSRSKSRSKSADQESNHDKDNDRSRSPSHKSRSHSASAERNGDDDEDDAPKSDDD